MDVSLENFSLSHIHTCKQLPVKRPSLAQGFFFLSQCAVHAQIMSCSVAYLHVEALNGNESLKEKGTKM